MGILISHPPLRTPAFVSWKATPGHLWPMLFVIVVCGAISGFHSLVASGTTSKQIASESDAKRIGYGAMILEGALAVIALISVCAGLYWKGPHPGLVYPELIKESGWIVTFGTVNETSVSPRRLTFWTIISTFISSFIHSFSFICAIFIYAF